MIALTVAWLTQAMAVTPDTPMTPNVNTIVSGFALVVGLFILRRLREIDIATIEHKKLPAAVEALTSATAAFSAKLDGVIHRFDRHCDEEETWQRNASDGAALAAKMTRDAIDAAEARLVRQMAVMEEKLTERRKTPR